MKKILILLILMLVANPVFASSKVIVRSMENFSTANPKTQMTVRVAETHKFKNGFTLEKGSVISGYVVKVTDPKRGKTRLASGGRCAYKNSPLVYVEKGTEMKVRNGDYLKLNFYDAQKPKWKVWKKL